MVTLFKKSRIGLVALGAMALMAIAGWQFGTNGTQEEFSGKEVAMENAIAGSGGNVCYNTITSSPGRQIRYCPTCSYVPESTDVWYSPAKTC